MRPFEDEESALSSILFSWSKQYSACWIRFQTDVEKLSGIEAKWAEAYGTKLIDWKRADRKRKKLPTARALWFPVRGAPNKVECILMATEYALTAKDGPFSRENWRTTPPEASDFIMVRSPRGRGDYAWTWRIQKQPAGLLEKHLIALVKTGDAHGIARATRLMRSYPGFRGIRGQLSRMLKGAKKLWEASWKSDWPGEDPASLPMMIGYRKGRAKGTKALQAPKEEG